MSRQHHFIVVDLVGEGGDVIFLDVSMAFVTIFHDIVISKVKKYPETT